MMVPPQDGFSRFYRRALKGQEGSWFTRWLYRLNRSGPPAADPASAARQGGTDAPAASPASVGARPGASANRG